MVPGWYGMTSVKWLTSIEAVTGSFDASSRPRPMSISAVPTTRASRTPDAGAGADDGAASNRLYTPPELRPAGPHGDLRAGIASAGEVWNYQWMGNNVVLKVRVTVTEG